MLMWNLEHWRWIYELVAFQLCWCRCFFVFSFFQLSDVSCWAMLFSQASCFIHHSHDNSPAPSFSPLDSRTQHRQLRLDSQGHSANQSPCSAWYPPWGIPRNLNVTNRTSLERALKWSKGHKCKRGLFFLFLNKNKIRVLNGKGVVFLLW